MLALDDILRESAALHRHLCPRQVLGARMAMLAEAVLGLDLPQTGKRLLTIVETDGCACDGIAVAANCWVGRRTMRIEDYGKVAATFVDVQTGLAIRIVPRREARQHAWLFAPEARHKWEAQLLGYQRMPVEMLFSVTSVQLTKPVQEIISRAGLKMLRENCGEEIINQREILHRRKTLCLACVGPSYYRTILVETPIRPPGLERV